MASLGILDGALSKRIEDVVELRRLGESTVPTIMGLEKSTNPFMRADHPTVRAAVGMQAASFSCAAVFGEIRGRKDIFKG